MKPQVRIGHILFLAQAEIDSFRGSSTVMSQSGRNPNVIPTSAISSQTSPPIAFTQQTTERLRNTISEISESQTSAYLLSVWGGTGVTTALSDILKSQITTKAGRCTFQDVTPCQCSDVIKPS